MLFKRINYILISIWITIFILYDLRFAAKYSYISLSRMRDELEPYSILHKNSQLEYCNYDSIFRGDIKPDIPINDIYKKLEINHIKTGGEYFPTKCNTQFSVALIVPYRSRPSQLQVFLNFFHHFLQTQNIHYRIFIVDQNNTKPFNRAKLLNVGAKEAMRLKFPCLILHDIDLIPLNYANLYVCTKQPRHMSTNVDIFRYNLLYEGLFGGATAILSEQLEMINGMSNMFSGWGGEDDDFYARLVHSNYTPCRYNPLISKYFMLKHKKQPPSENRYDILREGLQRYRQDGLSNISASQYKVQLKPLYTHIIVND